MYVFLQLLLTDQVFGSTAVRSVADQHELCWHFRADLRKDLDGIGNTLHGTEIRQVHQDRFAAGRPLGALLGIRPADVKIAVHEIRYDLNRPLNIEFLERLIQQVCRNCRNSVALFDGKLGDGQI